MSRIKPLEGCRIFFHPHFAGSRVKVSNEPAPSWRRTTPVHHSTPSSDVTPRSAAGHRYLPRLTHSSLNLRLCSHSQA